MAVLGLGADEQDALDFYLGAAADGVAKSFGGDIARQRYRELVDGRGRSRIVLSRRPVDKDSIVVEILGEPVTDWTLEDAARLYRAGGWPSGACGGPGEDGGPIVSVTFTAGFVTPALLSAWTASTTYAAGAWVRPSSPALCPYLMECTTGGASGSTEPTWGATSNVTRAEGAGALVWTVRDARELPAGIQRVALAAANHWHQRGAFAGDVRSINADGFSVSFGGDSQDCGSLPGFLEKALNPWRFD
jgi:hypothetical protein